MDDQLQIEMNEYLPLRDVVFNTLRQAILRGELKPGERLMEIKLAKRLGVSRTPIREAIRMLELEGLVVMIPRRGAAVAQITKQDLEDVLEVRCSLEELAVELACTRITGRELDHLHSALEQFETACDANDIKALAEKDVTFHDIIFESTGNQRLIQLLNNLREQMYRYRLEYLKEESYHNKLLQEHKQIEMDIKNHDVQSARQHIKEHIYNQVMFVSQKIEIEHEAEA